MGKSISFQTFFAKRSLQLGTNEAPGLMSYGLVGEVLKGAGQWSAWSWMPRTLSQSRPLTFSPPSSLALASGPSEHSLVVP